MNMKNREFENNFEQTSFHSSLPSPSVRRRQVFVLRKSPKEKSVTQKPTEAVSPMDFPVFLQKKEGKAKKEKLKEEGTSQIKGRQKLEIEETLGEFEEKTEEAMEEFEEKTQEAMEEFDEVEEVETMENEEAEGEEGEEEEERAKIEKEEESDDDEAPQEAEIDPESEEMETKPRAEKIPSSFFYVATQLLQTSCLGSKKASLQAQAVQSEGATIEEIEDDEISEQEKEELAVTYDQNSEREEEEEEEEKEKEKESEREKEKEKESEREKQKEKESEREKQNKKQGKDFQKEALEKNNGNREKTKEDKKQDEENLKEENKSKQRENVTQSTQHVIATSSLDLENKKDSALSISGSLKTTESQKNIAGESNAHLDLGTTSSPSPLLSTFLPSIKKSNESVIVLTQQNAQDDLPFQSVKRSELNEKEEKRKEEFTAEKSEREKKDSDSKIASANFKTKEKQEEAPEHIREGTVESVASAEPRSRFLPSVLSSSPCSTSSSVPFLSLSACSLSDSFSFSTQTQDKEDKLGDFLSLRDHRSPQTNVESHFFDQTLNKPINTSQYENSKTFLHAHGSSQTVADSKEPAQIRKTKATEKSSSFLLSALHEKEKKVSRPNSLPRLTPFLVSTDDLYSGSDNHPFRAGAGAGAGVGLKYNKQKKTRWKDVQESTKLPQKYMRLKSDTSPIYTELFSHWKEIENMYISASALFIAAAKKEIHSAIYDVEQKKEPYLSNGFALSLQGKRKNASFLALKTLLDKFEEERNSRLKNLGSEFVLEDFYSERVLKPMEEKTNYKTEASSQQTGEETKSPKPNSNQQQPRAAYQKPGHPQLFSPSFLIPSSVANHQLVLLLQQEPTFFQSMDKAVFFATRTKKGTKKTKRKRKRKRKRKN